MRPLAATIMALAAIALAAPSHAAQIAATAPAPAAQAERSPSVQDLIRELKTGTPYERASAAVALGNLGPEAMEAAPALIEALKDRESVRRYAASALYEIGLGDATGLTSLLKDKDNAIRLAAARAASEIGPAARTAVPALIYMAGDADVKMREAALDALGKVGQVRQDDPGRSVAPEVVPALVKALDDKEHTVRAAALFELGTMGPASAEVIAAVVRALGDKELTVRTAALESLGGIGSRGKNGEVIPIIVKHLKDADPAVRTAAARALEHFGPAAAEALPALFEALKLPDDGSHLWVGLAICTVRPLKLDTAPELIDIFTSRDRDNRWQAVWWLSRLGDAAKPAEPKLIIAVREDWDPDVRWAAAVALESLRTVNDEAVAALAKAAEDREIRVRIAALEALAWQALGGSEAAVPAIRRALADDRKEIRRAAVPSISGGSIAGVQPVIAEYIPLLKDKDDCVRAAAAQTIAVYAHFLWLPVPHPGRNRRPLTTALPAMTAVIPDLIRMLKEDPDCNARLHAAMILGELGPEARKVTEVREIVAALIEAMNVKDDSLSGAAMQSLGALGPITPEVVPALVKAATGGEATMRGDACQALGKIGVADPAVVPALIRAMGDEHIEVRIAAADALREIGPDARAAAPALLENLKARNNEVPVHAAQALVHVGVRDAAIVPTMLRLLRDGDWLTKGLAVDVLAELGPAASDATGALCEIVRTDKYEMSQVQALAALEKIMPPADDVVPTVVAALGDRKSMVRVQAAKVLAAVGFGKRGKECVAALMPLLTDPDEWVRSAAAAAIEKARPGDIAP